MFGHNNSTCDKMCLLAAKANGKNESHVSLEQLQNIFDCEKLIYPCSNENMTCQIIGTYLVVNVKVSRMEWNKVLMVETVEVVGDIDWPKNSIDLAKNTN